jgi:hypothetical protein
MYIQDHFSDPFAGIASSATQSSIIDTRDAFDLSLSWRTSSGTASAHSYQVSNVASVSSAQSATYDAHWSTYTVFGSAGGSTMTTFEPPLGYRFARIIRTASAASLVIEVNKTVR